MCRSLTPLRIPVCLPRLFLLASGIDIPRGEQQRAIVMVFDKLLGRSDVLACNGPIIITGDPGAHSYFPGLILPWPLDARTYDLAKKDILLSLPIFQRLLGPELFHFDGNCLINTSLELRAVPKHEQ